MDAEVVVNGENYVIIVKYYTNSCLTALWRSWRWKGFLLKKCERRKKINNKWVEGTPNPDLLEDFLPVNQFQLYHVKYACV